MRSPVPINTGRLYDVWPWTRCPSSLFDKTCTAPRAAVAQDVLIVVKTGGTEQISRLKDQLDTLLSTVPKENVLVLSDLTEKVDSVPVLDIFADLSPNERKHYPEFELYTQIQKLQKEGQDTRMLNAKGGWDLDKYKNLPMARKIWRDMQEGNMRKMKWFLFIDTDTYIEWDNLAELLSHFDASSQYFFGSPVWVSDVVFGHGGTGYVLSYGTMEALNKVSSSIPLDDPMYSQYGLNVTSLCCGDLALAKVLQDKAGIKIKGFWLMFNGEIPSSTTYGGEIWCEPVVSLHHIGEKNLAALWTWVEGWKKRTKSVAPLLFKDLFDYIAADISATRNDWDNTEEGHRIYPPSLSQSASSSTPHKIFTSFEQCRAACEADVLCFQFVFQGTSCALAYWTPERPEEA
ncbi:hypothetical protein ACEPPN_003836 [Leptodophora sp. 'Broadleaf-Isolate-01']